MKFKGRKEFENQLNIISDSDNVSINEIKSLKINNYEYRKDLLVIHKSCFFFSNSACPRMLRKIFYFVFVVRKCLISTFLE